MRKTFSSDLRAVAQPSPPRPAPVGPAAHVARLLASSSLPSPSCADRSPPLAQRLRLLVRPSAASSRPVGLRLRRCRFGRRHRSQACSPVDAAGALCRSRTEQVTPGTNGVAQFLQALHLSSECSRRECLRLIAVALRINARDKASERKTFETLPCTKKFTWWCTALGRGTGELGPTERGAPEEREDDDEEEEREDDDEEEEREDDDEEEREDDEEEEREDDDEEQEREDDDEEEEREDDDEEEEREDDDEEEEREDDDEEEEREDDDEEEEREDDDEEEEREDDDEEEREEEEKGEDEEEKCV
ncbi:hypothetical protein TGCAST_364480 [Toxoplasma gondii CAST]|uniref:Uncharacterized protein n=2 Tax=Toxoplasma gondii TaxID=5811 RepID=A0A3R7Z5W4_TOXGO|nr:hypothetical protein TGBR9_364480 [Toxoplasma gondii TgCATBr9]RQX70197.1 hypothetical protein TGCAST_364480 [Toxoplasma gondii CAST]